MLKPIKANINNNINILSYQTPSRLMILEISSKLEEVGYLFE